MDTTNFRIVNGFGGKKCLAFCHWRRCYTRREQHKIDLNIFFILIKLLVHVKKKLILIQTLVLVPIGSLYSLTDNMDNRESHHYFHVAA